MMILSVPPSTRSMVSRYMRMRVTSVRLEQMEAKRTRKSLRVRGIELGNRRDCRDNPFHDREAPWEQVFRNMVIASYPGDGQGLSRIGVFGYHARSIVGVGGSFVQDCP